MAEKEVEVLRRAREAFVRKRRAMAEQMVPEGAAAAHFAPSFFDLQAAIEAIDRAMRDEETLAEGYAGVAQPDPPMVGGEGTRSNVVDVDFDPA